MQQRHVILPDRYLDVVRHILARYVPTHEVWMYGSRVGGTAYPASDIDLVVRDPADLARPCPALGSLRTAFQDSDLPLRVDVLDWARLPPSFQREIERAYAVVQRGRQAEEG